MYLVEARWGNGEIYAWLLPRRPGRHVASWAMQQLPYGFDHYSRGGLSVRAGRVS